MVGTAVGSKARVAVGAVGLVVVVNAAHPAAAAPPVSDEGVVMRVNELTQSAVREIERRRFDRARQYLLDAERSAKERGGVVAGAGLARTYIVLGALEITTGGDADRAKHHFRRAVCRERTIRPDAAIDSPDVERSFEAAKAEVAKATPQCRFVVKLQQRSRRAPEPNLPARIQALDCPNPDEGLAGSDFVLRCAVSERLPVAPVKLFYRPAGSEAYAAVEMARSARGWWTAAMPGRDVGGTSVPYYFEGQNAAGKAIVRNGDPDSPNYLLVISPDGCPCD